MKAITKEELAKKIELHQKWLNDEEGGERLELVGYDLRCSDLRGCDLGCSNLSRSDLSGSDLRCSNLGGSNLSGSDLSGCNLSGSDLDYSNLSRSNLRGSDLRRCNLSRSNLSRSDLRRCNLSRSDLRRCNLSRSDLSGSDLQGCHSDEYTSFFQLQCPEEGAFIAWKHCRGYIVKLLVTENAKRSSATSRKCRCSEAVVLEIQNLDGSASDLNEVHSDNCNDFVYRRGEIVRVEDFCEDRWKECAPGIHFFITREEAVQWRLS